MTVFAVLVVEFELTALAPPICNVLRLAAQKIFRKPSAERLQTHAQVASGVPSHDPSPFQQMFDLCLAVES